VCTGLNRLTLHAQETWTRNLEKVPCIKFSSFKLLYKLIRNRRAFYANTIRNLYMKNLRARKHARHGSFLCKSTCSLLRVCHGYYPLQSWPTPATSPVLPTFWHFRTATNSTPDWSTRPHDRLNVSLWWQRPARLCDKMWVSFDLWTMTIGRLERWLRRGVRHNRGRVTDIHDQVMMNVRYGLSWTHGLYY